MKPQTRTGQNTEIDQLAQKIRDFGPSLPPETMDELQQLLSSMRDQANSSTADHARRRRRQNEGIKFLTVEELECLFKVIRSSRDRAIFRLAYHRGLRASEIGLLQLSDLRMKAGRIQVRRLKGSFGGEYQLVRHEELALRAWLRERGSTPGPLFPSRNRRKISRQQLDLLIKRYGALAGIPPEKRHFHALKHSCATHMYSMGCSTEDVQDHLGHADIRSTTIYAKYGSKRRAEREERLRNW